MAEKYHTTFKIISYLTIWLCLLVVGYVFYLYVLQSDPVTIKTPMQTDKTEYRIGDTITYTIDFCKKRDYKITSLNVYLADGFLYQLPTANTPKIVAPNGCYKVDAEVPLIVPENIPIQDSYILRVVIGRQLNPFRYDTATYETTPFKIIQ